VRPIQAATLAHRPPLPPATGHRPDDDGDDRVAKKG
jgi:hypothetical protein